MSESEYRVATSVSLPPLSMDVPFIASGALSSAHYALIRAVESASSPQQADEHLRAEVAALRARLARPGLSTQKKCREALVVLFYCATAAASLRAADVAFALPHAVALAEAGASITEQRVGYMFCTAVMPPDHEMRLMLVNTLRKDLYAHSVARIALALDFLVQSPDADTVPAVQARLHDLLSHPSAVVRRKTLYAVRGLATVEPSLLRWLAHDIAKRVRDADPSVAGAAIATCSVLQKHGLLDGSARAEVRRAFAHFAKSAAESPAARLVLMKILGFYAALPEVPQEVVSSALGLLGRTTRAMDALRLSLYSLLRHVPSELLITTPPYALLAPIRPYVVSFSPNDQHFFLSCLGCVDPSLWAGGQGHPAVLDSIEVERIMQGLSSPDDAIRAKTIRILARVEPSLLKTYAAQLLANPHAGALPLLLELAEASAAEDAGAYAQAVHTACAGPGMHEQAIERVLSFLRDQSDGYASDVVTALLTPLVDTDASTDVRAAGEGEGSRDDGQGVEKASPTMLVIATALACEYAGRVPVAPVDVLSWLARELHRSSPSVQDAMLLVMIRLAAECESVSARVKDSVAKLKEGAGRHVQRRCTQFLDLIVLSDTLREIVSGARSRSLPDFLASLEAHQAHLPLPRTAAADASPTRSHAVLSAAKLRYDPYAAPVPAQRQRQRGRHAAAGLARTNSGASADGGRSEGALSARSDSVLSRRSDDLARTVSPGELALAAGSPELRAVALGPSLRPGSAPRQPSVDLLASRVDLIALDSPFLSDPPGLADTSAPALPDTDIRALWDALAAHSTRGWTEMRAEDALRKLRELPCALSVRQVGEAPFEGEVKVLLRDLPDAPGERALVRLRDDADVDDGGCLWRVRSDGEALVRAVRRGLADG
ncbi:armadillo-type protein [Vararia minispora EC-137]|uniref:Armadillo-type protein n=1 Tax=Vararia minispora EC-137 TaxID=1314806 RepID=A0ACB8Q9R2_9AGAM|nr:armadillo-type protein [Vararia minispora EC-137]